MPKEVKRKEKRKKRKKKHKSDNYEEIHELSFYLNDRFKLMKEVVKIMKARKIKSMAPDFLKDLAFDDVMVLLMDELLGISKKRLKYIFEGKGDDIVSSSSTDSEEEKEQSVAAVEVKGKPVEKQKQKQADDVISLSDISDDDDIMLCSEKAVPLKEAPIKKEKGRKYSKTSKKEDKKPLGKDKLMSVLELLELQARARAIRSQLTLEAQNEKEGDASKPIPSEEKEDSDPEAVVIQSPKRDEIVISSEDESDSRKKQKTTDVSEAVAKSASVVTDTNSSEAKPSSSSSSLLNSVICGNRKTQKIKIIRDRTIIPLYNSSNNTMRDKSMLSEEKSLQNKESHSDIAVQNVSAGQKEGNSDVTSDNVPKTDAPNAASVQEKGNLMKPSSQNNGIVSEQKKLNNAKCRSGERTNSCSDNEPDVIMINLDDSDDLQCDDV